MRRLVLVGVLATSGCFGRGGFRVHGDPFAAVATAVTIAAIANAVATPPPVVVNVEYVDPNMNPGHVWVNGHYVYAQQGWVWQPGFWQDERAGYVWVQGAWVPQDNQYVWVEGHWDAPRAGYTYVEGYWDQQGQGWVWMPGRWEADRAGAVWVHGHWDDSSGQRVWIQGSWQAR
jgi:hypothetical protein